MLTYLQTFGIRDAYFNVESFHLLEHLPSPDADVHVLNTTSVLLLHSITPDAYTYWRNLTYGPYVRLPVKKQAAFVAAVPRACGANQWGETCGVTSNAWRVISYVSVAWWYEYGEEQQWTCRKSAQLIGTVVATACFETCHIELVGASPLIRREREHWAAGQRQQHRASASCRF